MLKILVEFKYILYINNFSNIYLKTCNAHLYLILIGKFFLFNSIKLKLNIYNLIYIFDFLKKYKKNIKL